MTGFGLGHRRRHRPRSRDPFGEPLHATVRDERVDRDDRDGRDDDLNPGVRLDRPRPVRILDAYPASASVAPARAWTDVVRVYGDAQPGDDVFVELLFQLPGRHE